MAGPHLGLARRNAGWTQLCEWGIGGLCSVHLGGREQYMPSVTAQWPCVVAQCPAAPELGLLQAL